MVTANITSDLLDTKKGQIDSPGPEVISQSSPRETAQTSTHEKRWSKKTSHLTRGLTESGQKNLAKQQDHQVR